MTVALLLPDDGQTPPISSESQVNLAPVTPAAARPVEQKPAAAPAEPAAEPETRGTQTTLTVGRGDSLDYLFRRNELSIADLTVIMQQDIAREHLRLIKPGDEIRVTHDGEEILSVSREIDFSQSLQVDRNEDGFAAQIVEHAIQARQVQARGSIEDSLFLSAAEAGVSDRIIMNLAGIFAWDIDFVLDIRRGDQFKLIVEELWRDGRRVAEGDILAAEFVNQGESYRAVLYRAPDGTASYFSPDGKNMRKAFLRAPLSFSRISSNFNPNRRHPVLNTLRAHKGVDYAAPTGTPVKAAGEGKVIFSGTKGGYGKTVILQHGGNITTLYAHMSRFNRASRTGMRVRQGSVFGYVGQSGLATGPHLHYEYRKNGVHLNPRTVRLPDAAPIDPALKDDFLQIAAPLLAKLDRDKTLVAQRRSAAN